MQRSQHRSRPRERALFAGLAIAAFAGAPAAADVDLAPAGACAEARGAHGSLAVRFSPQDVAADAPPALGGGPAPAPFPGREACDGAGGCGGQNELPVGMPPVNPPDPGGPPSGSGPPPLQES